MPNIFNNLLAKVDDWFPLIIIAGVIVINVVKAISNNAKSTSQSAKPNKADYNKSNRESENRQARHLSKDNSYKTLEQMQAERAAQIRKAQMQGKLRERQKAVFVQPPLPKQPTPQQPRPEHKPVQRIRAAQPQQKTVTKRPRVDKQPSRRIQRRPQAPHHRSKIDLAHSSIAAGEIGTKNTSQAHDHNNIQFLSSKTLRQAIIYSEILAKPLALRDIV